MQRYHDRVKETSTTTGAGNLTLAGAVSQFKSFTSRYTVGHRFSYSIVGQTGAEWESGTGYLSGTTTLVREVVSESSNADALVNFSAGTKDVFVTLIAEDIEDFLGENLAFINGFANP